MTHMLTLALGLLLTSFALVTAITFAWRDMSAKSGAGKGEKTGTDAMMEV